MNKVNMLSLVISILVSVQVSFGAVKNVSQSVGGSTSATSQAAGFEAEKAFDGKIDTQWQANDSSTPQILWRDLGKVKVVNNITTTFPDVYAYCYSIYVSTEENPTKNLEDESVWTKVIGPKVVQGKVTEKIVSVKARHIATKIENMVSNSGFEDKSGAEESQIHGSAVCRDWGRYVKTGGTFSLDTKVAHSGKMSVMGTDENLPKSEPPKFYGIHLYHSYITVKPNTTYTYSVYLRAAEGEVGLAGIRLDQYTSAKGDVRFADNREATALTKWGEYEIATSKWKKFTVTTRTMKDCELVNAGIFYYKQSDNPNRFWADDMFLIEGDTETDISGIVEQEIN